MNKLFNVVIEKNKDGYISEVIELPGCHTQGKTIEELMANTKEAIELYIEVMKEDLNSIEFNFVGVEQIQVRI